MLEVVKLEQKNRWDEIVRSFRDYDVYYLNCYLKSLFINGDGIPLLFYYEGDGLRGINVVLKRDVSFDARFEGKIEPGKYFDFTTPYGYGGWIMEGEGDRKKLFAEYGKWCLENSIICEFVRFHPLIGNQRYCIDDYNVIPLGQVIALDLRDKNVMWANMSSRNRNKIKKAMNFGVSVSMGQKEKLDEFIEIYEDTMDRDNAEEYYYFKREYYDCLFDELGDDEIYIFNSELDGKMLSNCIIFKVNGRLSYHLAGSTRTSGNIYETNLLIYQVGLWGNENNCVSLILGGGVGSAEDNLYRFKKGFDDKHSYQFYIGKKMYNQQTYDYLVSLRDDIANMNYFPAYRG